MASKLFTLFCVAVCVAGQNATNNRPIIAIFSAPSTSKSAGCEGSCDYLAASYIKWVESAGGRVVPVPFHASHEHIDLIFKSVNGLIFPGGGASMSDSAKYFYSKAVASNKAGDFFPVWGTCLGFEWLIEVTSASDTILDKGFDSENITLALELTSAAADSRMFGKDKALMAMLSNATNPPTMNNHQAGIETKHFQSTPALSSFYNILSTNKDRKGREFISTIEGKDLPIYGTQWYVRVSKYGVY
jgi:gamma-glutamyl hydrolase